MKAKSVLSFLLAFAVCIMLFPSSVFALSSLMDTDFDSESGKLTVNLLTPPAQDALLAAVFYDGNGSVTEIGIREVAAGEDAARQYTTARSRRAARFLFPCSKARRRTHQPQRLTRI